MIIKIHPSFEGVFGLKPQKWIKTVKFTKNTQIAQKMMKLVKTS